MKLYLPASSKALLLTFVLILPFAAHGKRQVLDRSIVTVNDDIILESDVDAFRQKAKSKNFQELFGGLDPKKLESREAVLQLLVEEKLIDQQVKKLELTVTDPEVDRHIKTILERNGISDVQLKARLKDLGTSLAEYREGIKRQLERRNLVEREIKPMMEVSDEELRHFLLRNSGDSGMGQRFELAHILVTTKGKPGEARAKKILDEAVGNPSNFAALAKEYSDDQATSSTGGDLGKLSIDTMASEFREAAKKTPVGKVFPKVIKTAGGLHILKVAKSEQMSFADLPEDQKAQLRNQLMAQELEKKMASWLERRKMEAHIRRSDTQKSVQRDS
jgi:peptidyl-prolyl cis-trans isomerase SurA